MILVQSNPSFQERWEALPDDQRESFGRRHLALDRELRESGELIGSEALADPSQAKRVTAVDGRRIVFAVTARDETQEIGNGVHERALVDLRRLAQRLDAKRPHGTGPAG